MEVAGLALGVTQLVHETLQVYEFSRTVIRAPWAATQDLYFNIRLYGLAGIIIALFGNRSVWKAQMQVINLGGEKQADNWKKSTLDESNIIAVAASIVVQIAITALSLDGLGQAHWTARGFLVFSLTSATMAVYSATTQCRVYCQLISSKDIKRQIKVIEVIELPHNLWITSRAIQRRIEEARVSANPIKVIPAFTNSRSHVAYQIPSVPSMITASAPFTLLTSALHSFLIGFGIYLGYLWTRNLGQDITPADNRSVFITYVTGLGSCYLIYVLANTALRLRDSSSIWLRELKEGIGKQPKTPVQSILDLTIDPTSRTAQDNRTANADPPNEDIAHTLRQSAQLRRALAESEEHLASLYEQLERNSTEQP